jgi:hypothetical protein
MTAALRIDQGIELPPARRGGARDAITLALDTMQVGESFAMPAAIKHPGARVSLANVRLKPKRFARRKRGGEFRVWRIA